jgi:predicted RNase H-like HicB family nuclease
VLTAYIEAAMTHARFEFLAEDQEWYGEIPELPGVWAVGATETVCRTELQSTLEGWLALGLQLGHDIPVIDGHAVRVALAG